MSKATTLPDISTWVKLQAAVPEIKTEEMAAAMLQKEKQGERRIQWMLRLHAKFNELRKQRERRELMTIAGAK